MIDDEDKLRNVPHIEIRRTDERPCLDVDVREGIAPAVKFLRSLLQGREQESFVFLALDGRGRVTSYREVARGLAGHVEVPVRELFRAALMVDARYLVISHNHPSGDPTPSQADVYLTAALRQAGALVNVPIIDHVIIGDGERYYSFQQGTTQTTAEQPMQGKRPPPEFD